MRAAELEPLALKPFSFVRKTRRGTARVDVLIAVLTAAEVDAARVAAAQWMEREDPRHRLARRSECHEDQETYEVLMRALRDPKAPQRPWQGANGIRDLLSVTEMKLLADAYMEHERESVSTVVAIDEDDDDFEGVQP